MPKVPPLIYQFTFEEWVNHPSTKPKLKWCKKVGAEIRKMRLQPKQFKLNL
jgi:hypothetical protein